MNIVFSKILYANSVLMLLLLFLPKETIQRKLIRDGDYDYVVYVCVNKSIKPNHFKTYFWYKSGQIKSAVGGIGGEVLHREYIKYYSNKQLAEQGIFHYGLKDGTWKSWYKDGTLKSITQYNKGIAHGRYYTYDTSGNITTKGYYSQGKKSGTWITYGATNDTLKYKKGEVFVKKEKDTLKPSLLKRISKWVKEKTRKKKDSLRVDDEIKELEKKEKKRRRKKTNPN